MNNYYQILGVASNADSKAIRKAWLQKARQYHPDHNPGNSEAEEQFKVIQEAYRVLSDKDLRSRYDLSTLHFDFIDYEPVRDYFYVVTDVSNVKLNEEISITFTYSGQGRIFRRPDFNGFFITGAPFVSSRYVIHEGAKIKETSLTFILSPLIEGDLQIGKASIRIRNKIYQSETLTIHVEPNNCYFLENQKADGRPFKYVMHYGTPSGASKQLPGMTDKKRNHVLLIPRSRAALLFHNIGTAIKIVCTIWGAVMLHYWFDLNVLAGALTGSVIGGLNVQIMYRLLNMKSKFYFAPRYFLVKEYEERGYMTGTNSGSHILTGQVLYYIGRLLV